VAARRPRVLTARALNRALLARQGLLDRYALSIPRTLERIGGIQAQYAPSMYIGLWSRMEGLDRAALTRALERRTVVQATLMRTTIHLFSARDYWLFADGTRGPRRAWWQRVTTDRAPDAEMERAAERLRAELAAADGGALRRADVEALLGKPVARAIGMWIDLVRAPPSGTWERRRADLYAAAEDWVAPPSGDATDRARAGAEHLVRRYLAAFGPATRGDVAGWAGIPVGEFAAAFDALRLRRFVTDAGEELVDLPRVPLPPADAEAPVRFLPSWDATLLVHARRTGILPEEYRPRIFHTKNPQSVPTFLVDGSVAGAWRQEGGRVEVEPFRRLGRSVTRALREEAGRLEGFLR
jgi:winged helix DNA-binding protein